MACKAVKAFGEGIQKGMDENRPLEEKVGDVREAVIKGVMEAPKRWVRPLGRLGTG